MKLNKTVIQVVENTLKKKFPLQVSLNKSWQFLYQEYNIGLTQGTKLTLDCTDKDRLVEIIFRETGLNLLTQSVKNLSNLHREQTLAFSHNEKWAGKPVKTQRLAFKTLTNQILLINQAKYSLPVGGHMDMSLEQIHSIEHNCLLVIRHVVDDILLIL